jgi:Flp pilus assembly pilin Flp
VEAAAADLHVAPSEKEYPMSDGSTERVLTRLHQKEDGLATAEYGIVMLAAVAFAGLLTAILTSETVRGWLEAIVQQALGAG